MNDFGKVIHRALSSPLRVVFAVMEVQGLHDAGLVSFISLSCRGLAAGIVTRCMHSCHAPGLLCGCYPISPPARKVHRGGLAEVPFT